MAKDGGGSAGAVLMAFALGALAGAAVALLYAPAAGEETRRRLAEKARAGRARAEEAAREFRDRAETGRDFVQRQRENLSEAIERGRQAFDQARKETL